MTTISNLKAKREICLLRILSYQKRQQTSSSSEQLFWSVSHWAEKLRKKALWRTLRNKKPGKMLLTVFAKVGHTTVQLSTTDLGRSSGSKQ